MNQTQHTQTTTRRKRLLYPIENFFPTTKYTSSTISQEKKEFVIGKKVFDELSIIILGYENQYM